jgi:hypothetical protein
MGGRGAKAEAGVGTEADLQLLADSKVAILLKSSSGWSQISLFTMSATKFFCDGAKTRISLAD